MAVTVPIPRPFLTFSALSIAAAVNAFALASGPQNIAIDRPLQIPGETLKPGTYAFSIEDRLADRAIVRIENTSAGTHYLVLTVPTSKVPMGAGNNLIFFSTADASKAILQGWACPTCDRPLEFVYPKEEAAQLTTATGQSVLAADPAYDKLPPNLSPDDMKVVTLWLLSPEHISDHRGVGLKAAKYIPLGARHALPRTASNTYSFAFAGLALLIGFVIVRLLRSRKWAA